MTTSTLTLSAFLLARIEEDEAVALAAFGETAPGTVDEGRWSTGSHEADACRIESTHLGMIIYDEGGHSPEQATHIARHDPARVLAECKAKRAIVDEHVLSDYNGVPSCYLCAPEYSWGKEPDEGPCKTLAALASVYADHVDFNPDWS